MKWEVLCHGHKSRYTSTECHTQYNPIWIKKNCWSNWFKTWNHDIRFVYEEKSIRTCGTMVQSQHRLCICIDVRWCWCATIACDRVCMHTRANRSLFALIFMWISVEDSDKTHGACIILMCLRYHNASLCQCVNLSSKRQSELRSVVTLLYIVWVVCVWTQKRNDRPSHRHLSKYKSESIC